MKRGNIEFGVLIAVAAVAAFGAVFMFSANNDASAMAIWTTPSKDPGQITTCELGCYQDFEGKIVAGTNPAPQALQHCITYCNNLPPY